MKYTKSTKHETRSTKSATPRSRFWYRSDNNRSSAKGAIPKFTTGYTLIEALVAITIIVFATVGPLTLAAKSLAESQYVRDQITAFYLAQETLEIVRHTRDVNPGIAFRTIPMIAPCVNNQKCDVNVADLTIKPYTTILPTPLRMVNNDASSLGVKGILYEPDFSSSSVIPQSKFTRWLTISTVPSNLAESRIVATVEWNNGLNRRRLVLEESLFDL